MTKAREINPENAEVRAMDQALIDNPPIIHWRKNSRGVFVAALIDDPHADIVHNGSKKRCPDDHPYTEENTIVTRDGKRRCRVCTNKTEERRRRRMRETPLLTAARTQI